MSLDRVGEVSYLLSDVHWENHKGSRYLSDDVQYDFTVAKSNNVRFNELIVGQRLVTLRLNRDETITAVHFLYEKTSIVFGGTEGQVHGKIVQVEHFTDRKDCKAYYPEAFERIKDKFVTGLNIKSLLKG
tara:strand:+ start:676 stop:1065 length:390 start_codon:yes stop_codon:yes gene_type:complete